VELWREGHYERMRLSAGGVEPQNGSSAHFGMGWVSAEDYGTALPDPLAEAAPGIIQHMNADHDVRTLPFLFESFANFFCL